MKEFAPTRYTLGEYTLDPAARELRRAGEPVPLSSLPFRVLVHLVEHRDRVVTRAELLDTFWDGKDVYDNTLHKCVGAIRKALDDSLSSPRFVETRHREGYRYVGPFEEDAPEPVTVEIERTRGVSVVIESEPGSQPARRIAVVPRAAAAVAAATAAAALVLLSSLALVVLVAEPRPDSKTALPPAQPAPRSIAVLPFENLSGDRDAEVFGDGLAESLIGDLATIDNLKVISRRSAFVFKGTDADPRDVGRKLGVETVLEGSIRRAGDAVRVDVRLVSTTDGRVLWASDADERLTGDALDVEEALACRLGAELRVSLCGEGERVAKRYTGNAAAYREYLKGRYHWHRRTERDLQEAVERFEAAVAVDPSYALAYAGLAETYAVMEANSVGVPGASAPLGEASARKALELDETLASAWAALGLIRNCAYDWPEGERLLTHALELSPRHGPARFWYAHSLMVRGRFEEAAAQLEQARASDPLSYPIAAGQAELYYHWRKYDRAVEHAKAAVAIDPDRQSAYWIMATSYLALGMEAEALEASARSGASGHEWMAVHISGNRDERRRLADETARSEMAVKMPYSVACTYARMGEVEEALRWLGRAYEAREADLAKLGVAPELDPLRSDPRYAELVRRVGVAGGS